MNKKLLFSGGETNINMDDLLRQQYANTAAVEGLAVAMGINKPNFIISGVTVGTPSGGNTPISSGYVWLNGQLIQVEAQNVADLGANEKYKVELSTTFETAGDKAYADGSSHQTWQKNRGIVSKVASSTTVDLEVTDANRVQFMRPFQITYSGTWNTTGGLQQDVAIPSWMNSLSNEKILSMVVNATVFYTATIQTITARFNLARTDSGTGAADGSIASIVIHEVSGVKSLRVTFSKRSGATTPTGSVNYTLSITINPSL